MSVEFARSGFLYLLLILPLWWLLVWPWGAGGIQYAGGEFVIRSAGREGGRFAVLGPPRLLRMGAMACLLVALSEPQRVEVVRETELRGEGIALAVDISTSMLATDMEDEASRLTVAREAAIRFSEGRELDELSLVAFAGQATTRVPATTDPNLIVAGVESLEVQLVFDGTNISAAVLASMGQLLSSEREPRVIVLLTDGAHNIAGVTPLTTGRAAAALGVRVHSIALLSEPDLSEASTTGRAAAIRRRIEMESEMETVLTAISRVTGGEYFRASSGAALDSIYREINEIEAPVEEVVDVEVRYPLRTWPLLLGILLFSLEVAFRGSRWAVVP